MDKTKYKSLFKQIIKMRPEKEQNLEKIEKKLQHLREGDALVYEDLENIADDSCWPFNKYWMWPSRLQIEEKLKGTSGWFKNLPKNENKIIDDLNKIFKNIALVSIVLRFVFPEHYAIYSRPSLKILRVERGANDVEEYLNYVQELRILKHSFRATKTSEVDMIVWAIFYAKGEYINDFKKLLAEHLPENLTPNELVTFLSYSPLKIAKAFYKQGEYKTSGFWAAKAFEKFLYDECFKNSIIIHEQPHKRAKMIENLCFWINKWANPKNKNILKDTKRIRNKIIPGVKNFARDDVNKLIGNIETLNEISLENGG